MSAPRLILLVLVCFALFGSCSLVSNTIDYRKTSEEFIESAIKEDYDKCISLFALERPEAKDINIDTLKKGVKQFRNAIVNELGTDIEYTFLSSVKSFSSSGKSPADLTEVQIELAGNEKYDVVVLIFDDISKKILNIKSAGLNKAAPAMAGFWLFGLLCLCVPAFNIYMIIRIKRSNRKRKWLKYISLIFLNVPTISFNAATGIVMKPLFLQVLLGVSFNFGGYENSKWELGIPLAGLYWLWRLTVKPYVQTREAVEESSSQVIGGPLDQVRNG
jgi:hypothetical protein